jgi:transposase
LADQILPANRSAHARHLKEEEIMPNKKRRSTQPEARRPKGLSCGQRTRRSDGKTITTFHVGALPVLNQLLERMKLREFLTQRLPPTDKRTKLDAPRVILLLLKNILVSREPMYGVGEWACNYGSELFDLWPAELEFLNDDRVGRCLHELSQALTTSVVMDVVTHVVREFRVNLDQLHNDSTTITFTGQYAAHGREQHVDGQTIPAITWGHNKDHRPDLKQLLYILTVSEDGGVPIYFQAASGNVVDDQTHQATWKLLATLVKRPDFVYVADCKLATTDNMNEIARQGGRFITVLSASRKEDTLFRDRLRQTPRTVTWREVDRRTDEQGTVGDLFRVCTDEHVSKEGYRLLWFHSTAKAEADAETRSRHVQRTIQKLSELRQRLQSPRTRYRQREKVATEVASILESHGAGDWLHVEVIEQPHETYRQTKRGRPTSETQYTRHVVTRFDVTWTINTIALEQAAATDGVFPLITNLADWSAQKVLHAYKRQPVVEKRFSQLKSDFRVAPVYLQSVTRIVGLLTVYFFAMMLQALLERELRQAMKRDGLVLLPLYPEGRPCHRPTSRHVIDVFEPIARHALEVPGQEDPILFATELAPIHEQIITLLGVPRAHYRV